MPDSVHTTPDRRASGCADPWVVRTWGKDNDMGIFDRLRGGSERRALEAVYGKLFRLMTDEDVQNNVYPSQLQQLMAAGGGVDQLPGATGDFGRAPTNPIPVNGPLGELIYISNLVTSDGTQVIGHRLGSVDRIDAYEVVAVDGSRWDLLYFDYYHTRKSRELPTGYKASSSPERFLMATNSAVPNFPLGFYEAMRECTQRIIGIPMVSPQLRDESPYGAFSRPPSHLAALDAVRGAKRILIRTTCEQCGETVPWAGGEPKCPNCGGVLSMIQQNLENLNDMMMNPHKYIKEPQRS